MALVATAFVQPPVTDNSPYALLYKLGNTMATFYMTFIALNVNQIMGPTSHCVSVLQKLEDLSNLELEDLNQLVASSTIIETSVGTKCVVVVVNTFVYFPKARRSPRKEVFALVPITEDEASMPPEQRTSRIRVEINHQLRFRNNDNTYGNTIRFF